jgi:hypothetical protein
MGFYLSSEVAKKALAFAKMLTNHVCGCLKLKQEVSVFLHYNGNYLYCDKQLKLDGCL